MKKQNMTAFPEGSLLPPLGHTPDPLPPQGHYPNFYFQDQFVSFRTSYD